MSSAIARRLRHRAWAAFAVVVPLAVAVAVAVAALAVAGGVAAKGNDERRAGVLAYYQGKAP